MSNLDCLTLQLRAVPYLETLREREKLTSSVSKQDNWPVNKSDVVNKHIKHFIQFTNSVHFEKL
jgi:hypothetical protein